MWITDFTCGITVSDVKLAKSQVKLAFHMWIFFSIFYKDVIENYYDKMINKRKQIGVNSVPIHSKLYSDDIIEKRFGSSYTSFTW